MSGARLPITAYETDVRRIARVFEALELPLPASITLHLYPSTDRLAAGHVDDAGLEPILARTIGLFAAGVAVDDTLLMLEPVILGRRESRPPRHPAAVNGGIQSVVV